MCTLSDFQCLDLYTVYFEVFILSSLNFLINSQRASQKRNNNESIIDPGIHVCVYHLIDYI